MEEIDTIIIGAGPTGLSVASRLSSPHLILEREIEIGGLCRSFTIGGAVFDLGGHSFHTPHQEVLDYVCGLLPMYHQKRDARVAFGDQVIPYPFQKHFSALQDQNLVQECQAGLDALQRDMKVDNFEDFLRARGGEGIFRHFLEPYNRKLWGYPLADIDHHWGDERVALARGQTEPAPVVQRRQPLHDTSQVYYPDVNGFSRIFEAMAQGLNIRRNVTVVAVDPAARTLTLDSGETLRWNRLVSTIPLNHLLAMLSNSIEEDVRNLGAALPTLSLHLSTIVVDQPLPQVPQRVYVHEPQYPFHKITFNHQSSDYLRAAPCAAVMAETSFSDEYPLPDTDIEELLNNFLLQHGFLPPDARILHRGAIEVFHGYPVQTKAAMAAVATIRDALKPLGILTEGRFGAWRYINSDACIYSGWQVADQLNSALLHGRCQQENRKLTG